MACNIERPDPQELFDRYKNLFQNTVLGGAQIVPESNEWYATAVNYAMAEEFYAISEQAWKERDPRQACCENLLQMAADDGMYPRAAQPAQGYLKLSGTAGTVLPTPLEFSIDGNDFVTAYSETQPTAINADGTAVVRVRAVVPGAAGNLTEETGTMTTNVDDVESEVEVCGGAFCNGTDAEECEIFRQRYLRRLRYSPKATDVWVKDKLLEWPCATRVLTRGGSCCRCDCNSEPLVGGANVPCNECSCVDCGGKMHYYVMFDGSFDNGVAPDSVTQEIEEWMFGSPQGYGLGQVPIGICGRIIPVQGVKVDVTVLIGNCPTSSVLSRVDDIVADYFTTVEPSNPISPSDIEQSLQRVLGFEYDFVVEIALQNPANGRTGGSSDNGPVLISLCGLEPDCDYLLTLGDVVVTSDTPGAGGCP